MAKRYSSNPISWILFLHLRELYKSGVKDLEGSRSFRRVKLNGHHAYALSCYPLAVAAWEAFLNETCLSVPAEIDYPNSLLWDIKEKAEKWDVRFKSLLIPKLLLGTTFDKSAPPYQDFQHLVSIRNSIVHFKSDDAPVKTLQYLSQRKITLIPPPNSEYSWPLQL